MVKPTNRVIAWPDLRCSEPMPLWGFSLDLPAIYTVDEEQKKS